MPDDAEGDIVSALVEAILISIHSFVFMGICESANPEIPPLERWLEGFDMPPIDFAVQALTQSMDLLFDSAKTSVKPKNHPAAAVKK